MNSEASENKSGFLWENDREILLHKSESGVSPLERENGDRTNLQCPFTWKLKSKIPSQEMIDKIENKLRLTAVEKEDLTPWTKIIFNLILCYELSKCEQIDEAFSKIRQCETIIHDPQNSDSSKLMKEVAWQHIFKACKFFLLEKKQKSIESHNIIKDITKFEDMFCEDQALIYGVQCAIYLEYYFNSAECSVPIIEKAIDLDPNCAEWHYLFAKALSSIRHSKLYTENGPEDREIQALERSIKLSQNPLYMVSLAQSYIDRTRWIIFNKVKSGINCDTLNIRAVNLYRDAVEKAPDNGHILGRCAHGLQRLPFHMRKTELAKQYITRALEKLPDNGSYLLVAGKLFLKEDKTRAMSYFQQAVENGNFGATTCLMREKFFENQEYNPSADIEKYLYQFTEKHQKTVLYAQLGAFYYDVKKDYSAAMQAWWKAMQENIHDTSLTYLYVPWKGPNDIMRINNIINCEIKKYLNSQKDLSLYNRILEFCREYRPNLLLQ